MLRRLYKVRVSSSLAAAEARSSSAVKSGKGVLQIHRFDPAMNIKRIDTYEYVKNQDFMVLDLLTAVKAHQDPTLAFRASCCEGVCGSCAMNINGVNSLACITYAATVTQVGPLPNMPVIKDLVVDLKDFFKQYEYIRPFTRNTNLRRYHIESIQGRYLDSCKALYGARVSETDPAATPAATVDTAMIELLDKAVENGDVVKTIDALTRLKGHGTSFGDDVNRKLLQAALRNRRA